MYSFVNIATVVRDLARHPFADDVAQDLLRALGLDRAALALLDGVAVDAEGQQRRREQALQVDVERRRALPSYAGPLEVLERVTLGTLRDLQTFVWRDILADAWAGAGDLQVAVYARAIDVVADGVLGTFIGDAALGRPWRDAVTDLEVPLAATPWPHAVAAVRALPVDAEVPPAPAEWSQRVHAACWAVALTGRERAAAVAQLHALRALLELTGPLPALRTVAMVVAATHAAVVEDVLDSETYDAMTQPLFRLLP